MTGTTQVTFRTLFIDTIQTHGVVFAQAYYLKRGMSRWEFGIWLASVTY